MADTDEARESVRLGAPRFNVTSGKRSGAVVSSMRDMRSSPRGRGSPGRTLASVGGGGGRFLPTQSLSVDVSATLWPYMRTDAPSTSSSPSPITTALRVRPVGDSLGSRHRTPAKNASRRGEDEDLWSALVAVISSAHLNACVLSIEDVLIRQRDHTAHRQIFPPAHTLERETQVGISRQRRIRRSGRRRRERIRCCRRRATGEREQREERNPCGQLPVANDELSTYHPGATRLGRPRSPRATACAIVISTACRSACRLASPKGLVRRKGT